MKNVDFIISDPLQLQFGGFSKPAFDILERLRKEPHIGQYRKEKGEIERFITRPFREYRDDLVVNWVIPSRLDLETEKNVFSRLLKNDFGAGGCHHHLWMSFYRPQLSRLKDVQLSHCIRPEGFSIELFVGAYARNPLLDALDAMYREPEIALTALNRMLRNPGYTLEWTEGTGARHKHVVENTILDALPDWGKSTQSIRIRRMIPVADVIDAEGKLVEMSLYSVRDLWSLYLLWTGADDQRHIKRNFV